MFSYALVKSQSSKSNRYKIEGCIRHAPTPKPFCEWNIYRLHSGAKKISAPNEMKIHIVYKGQTLHLIDGIGLPNVGPIVHVHQRNLLVN